MVRTSRTAARLKTVAAVAAVAQTTAQAVAQAVQPPAGQTMQRSRQNSRSAWTAQATQYYGRPVSTYQQMQRTVRVVCSVGVAVGMAATNS